MRYLRMLVNSLLAGVLLAFYLAALFLHLNPSVPRGAGTVAPLLVCLLLSYGLLFALACYAALVVRQLLGGELPSSAWISLRVFGWLAFAATVTGATLMWLNLRALRGSLDVSAATRMAYAAVVLTICAVLLLMLLVVRHSVGPGAARTGTTLLTSVLVVSAVMPLWLRGPRTVVTTGAGDRPPPAFAPHDSTARLFLLLIDGASLDFISPAAADGRLPNFGRILDGGAAMHLATLRPTQQIPVWTSVATGKLPFRTGVRSAASLQVEPSGPTLDLLPDFCFAHALVYFGFLSEAPQTSAALAVRPFWDLLGASGIESVIVRWPLTYPARATDGVLVSDRFHVLPPQTPDSPRVTYPPELFWSLHTELAAGSGSHPTAVPSLPPLVASALQVDALYSSVFEAVSARSNARLLALRYEGLDTAGHYFLRQALPRVFGDVSDDERRKYGRVLEQYYRYLDGEVGRVMDRLGPDDVLLVVSGFGMQPLSMGKRLVDRALGSGQMSGSHERAPDGLLLAYGASVRSGHGSRAAVVDVAPTVLYFFGLPVARDMDGYARTDLFTPAFTDDRPLTFIPTYER